MRNIPEQEAPLPQIVVTAPQMSSPLTVVTDPKAPRQPVPAQDGADYLKTIPGFTVIRKGGADGDPVLRGMAGSRLNITAGGQSVLGGCGSRMDPPTAYIFPAEYDSITVIKGPQTVLYGAGGSAGTVLFERGNYRGAPGTQFNVSQMFGGYGRRDTATDLRYNTGALYLQAGANHSLSGDYRDGGGAAVHSAYRRWSSRAALGLTPDADTLVELSVAKSDGRAAYADRGVDGARFVRRNIGLKFEKRNLSPLLEKIEAQVYRNDIDHVMDNYTMRARAGMYAAMNPARTTEGARAAATLRLSGATQLTAGADLQRNRHTSRMAMGMSAQAASAYRDMARAPDANFRNIGLFGELTRQIGPQPGKRVIAGLRSDFQHAEDTRPASQNAMLQGTLGAPLTRDETLHSGFLRFENDLKNLPMTVYAGLGRTQRFPDYWELISKEGTDSVSAFGLKPETTRQIDAGALYRAHRLTLTASVFYNRIDDYILIQSQVSKGARSGVTVSRNVDASSWGGELGATLALAPHWKLDGSLNYVQGNNLTDGTPLAQMPPLETRFGLRYDDGAWSAAGMLRSVMAQNRFDANKGNIAGQDLGASAGFTVFSINAGWRMHRPGNDILISAGIDNLTNKLYAEHLSRSGASLPGYDQTMRINEPGRMFWLKAQMEL
ncbi:TonB-dependent copper receptor [Oxalobacteraceae bacterium CAVE-383]|nr:TonB-dependent copper receptor [Oxalobacteraceae bacterium CAVE-383]